MSEKPRAKLNADDLYRMDKLRKDLASRQEDLKAPRPQFVIRKEDLVKGIIFKEILGKPKGRI
ncbi:MAG: hypothetical protein R6W96_05285 [Clostridia bacterium]